MLHDASARTDIPPSSPIRRLVEPALSPEPGSPAGSVADAEFVTSVPSPDAGHSKEGSVQSELFQEVLHRGEGAWQRREGCCVVSEA